MAYLPPHARDGMTLMPRAAKRRIAKGEPDAAKDFREFEKIAAERQKHVPRWREIYNLMMPNRTAFDAYDQQSQPPQKAVSSHPSQALNRGVGNVISALFPFERVWFELLAGRDIPEDQVDEVNEALEKYRDIVADVISRSEYPSELTSTMRDTFCTLGSMRVTRGPSREQPVDIKSAPLAELHPIMGVGGSYTGMMRKYEVEANQLEAEFGGYGRKVTIPPSIADKMQADPTVKVMVLEVSRTIPRVGQRCTVYHFSDKAVIMDYVGSDLDEPSAWVTSAWGKVAGQTYPPGPADRALETARMLNHIEEADAKAFDRRVNPPYLVDEDSGMQPSTFRPVPYAKIPYSSKLLGGNPPVTVLPDGGNVQYHQLKAEEKKAELDDILFAASALPPVEESHGMTATEIRGRIMQKLREEGVDFGATNRAHGLGFIMRVVWILQTWGEIPPILKVNGRLFKLRYAGPLASAQDADDAQNLADTVQLSIATVGPEKTDDALRLEEVPGMLVDKRNAPASLKRTEQEMQQRAEQRMAMQAAQVAVENGLVPPQGAPAA